MKQSGSRGYSGLIMRRSKRNMCVFRGIGEHEEAYWMALCLAEGGKSGIVGSEAPCYAHTSLCYFLSFGGVAPSSAWASK